MIPPLIADDATGSVSDCDNISTLGNHCVRVQVPFDALIFILAPGLAQTGSVAAIEIHNPAAMVIVRFTAEFEQVLYNRYRNATLLNSGVGVFGQIQHDLYQSI